MMKTTDSIFSEDYIIEIANKIEGQRNNKHHLPYNVFTMWGLYS